MEYIIEVVTAPDTEPVTVDQLHSWLKLNDTSEDDLLEDFITEARLRFESMARRPILETVYRQHFYCMGPVELVRSGVTTVDEWKYYNTSNVLTSMGSWETDLVSPVPLVYLANANYPNASTSKRPVGYVEFTAGWADADAVPAPVKRAILLAAAHFYEQRAAFGTDNLKEVPMGFKSVAAMYNSGLMTWEGVA